jgi:hypothetical protein
MMAHASFPQEVERSRLLPQRELSQGTSVTMYDLAALDHTGRVLPIGSMGAGTARATATFEDICDRAFPALFNADRYTKGKWKNKNSEYAQ